MIDLDKQNIAFVMGVFLLGLLLGFEICILTVFRQAVMVAKSAIATAEDALTDLRRLEAKVKNTLMPIQKQEKSTKTIVH